MNLRNFQSYLDSFIFEFQEFQEFFEQNKYIFVEMLKVCTVCVCVVCGVARLIARGSGFAEGGQQEGERAPVI